MTWVEVQTTSLMLEAQHEGQLLGFQVRFNPDFITSYPELLERVKEQARVGFARFHGVEGLETTETLHHSSFGYDDELCINCQEAPAIHDGMYCDEHYET